MSKIKNGGLDQYGKLKSLNGIGGERVKIGLYWERVTLLTSDLDAVFEDVTSTSQTDAFPVHNFLTEDNDLFKQKNSPLMKLQLVHPAMATRLRNKQAVL